MARKPEPDDDYDLPELPELVASRDGTRHVGCGMPWAYCFCGYPRR